MNGREMFQYTNNKRQTNPQTQARQPNKQITKKVKRLTAGHGKFAQATFRDKHSRRSVTIRKRGSYKLRQKAFLIVISVKKSLTAIGHGFKRRTEAIDNLGTNLNQSQY